MKRIENRAVLKVMKDSPGFAAAAMRRSPSKSNENQSFLQSAANCGFTLTELLVVIVIIGVLAALLLPALNRAKASAKSAVCKGNFQQIGIALNLYLGDFEKYPLYYYHATPDALVVLWKDFLLPNCGGASNVFICPMTRGADPLVVYEYNWRGSRGNRLDLGLGGSYSSPSLRSLDDLDTPLSESRVLAPSEMIAVFHAFSWGWDIDAHLGFGYPGATWLGGKSFHQGGDLGVFCDSHVESSKSELIPRANEIRFNDGTPSVWTFKPDEARVRRLNNDNQPHQETWLY